MKRSTRNTPLNLFIVNQAIDLVKPDPRNPRKHSKQQIKQIASCIKEIGFVVPIVVDGDNKILSGHGRYSAAKLLGATHVPVIRLEHLTPEQARIFSIADNRLVENSHWDDELLADILIELSNPDLNLDLDLTGFSVTEIDLRISDLDAGKDSQPDPADQIIEQHGPIITKLGDVWLLGKHRIICGNSLEESTYERLMKESKACAIISDNPYNVKIAGHVTSNKATTHNEFAFASGEMSPEEFTAFLRRVFILLSRYSTSNSIHFQFIDWRHLQEIMRAGNDAYAQLINLAVWVKNSGGMGSMYRSRHELILIYANGKGPRRNNVQLGKFGRNRTNVWEYPGILTMSRQSEEGNLLLLHPTVKPVSMIADAILDCTVRNEVVLDPFLGSGTTLLACERTGRICHAIEIDPQYVQTAILRWQKFTGESAVDEQSGKTFNQLIAELETNHE